MAKNIKGPAIFLAQFVGDQAPFNSWGAICKWAQGLGYKGVQIPTWDSRLIDLKKAAESKTYCDEIKGTAKQHGIEITELSTHLQGQLVAVNPAYDEAFDAFAPAAVHGKPKERQKWAVEQVTYGAKASRNLGLDAHVSFCGALAWPFLYPWPARPAGMIDMAFEELGKRWTPILNAYEEQGVDVGFEIHPGEDTFDGVTFEMFLAKVIGTVWSSVKWPELGGVKLLLVRPYSLEDLGGHADQPSPKHEGVDSGFQPWVQRAGRFRSLGDGQVDFGAIFSKLAAYDYDSWAVLEWECCLKDSQQGAAEGAPFIESHLIKVTEKSFDDFTVRAVDKKQVQRMLGI